MLRSLYARLLVALLCILVCVGLGFVALAKWSSDRYHDEATQRLNATIAGYIVAEEAFFSDADDSVNSAALEHVAHMAMVINPIAEVYLLDADGQILGHALPPVEVTAGSVAIAPLQRYLAGAPPPVYGDDPRNPGQRQVFSVAPIEVDGEARGFLYVVLGGAQHIGAAQSMLDSLILRTSAAAAIAIVLFAVLVGVLVFSFLTRRLRRLVADLDRFEASGFHQPMQHKVHRIGRDEIDALAAACNRMSAMIVDQINRLETTDRTRRELIANVSHDLRTPIASMQGYVDTLLMNHDRLSPAQRKRYLEIASRHSRYLARLIEDLFELSCLDSGLVKPRTEMFSLSELVQDVAQKYQLQAAQARIQLEPRVDRNAPLVNADIGMIQQVLENLIANALRHTPPDGQVSVTVRPSGRRVSTVVADTGDGIASEDLPYIFDRAYTRSGTNAAQKRVHAGLGLAIVKRILDLHHSHVNVTSKVGEGSAFRFELAVAELDVA